jgi:hypothetical protein
MYFKLSIPSLFKNLFSFQKDKSFFQYDETLVSHDTVRAISTYVTRKFRKTVAKKIVQVLKYLEYKQKSCEITYDSQILFNLEFQIKFSGDDHAGPFFEISVLGLTIRMSIYDCRHWDYELNKWQDSHS